MGTLKNIIAIASLVVIVSAGDEKELGPLEQQNVLKLWKKLCIENQSLGESQHPNHHVHCKFGEDTEDVSHVVVKPTIAPSGPQKRIIFIEIPATRYHHDIILERENESPQKTTVYVLPPKKSEHKFHLQDTREQQIPTKPVVHFLKNDPSSLSGYPAADESVQQQYQRLDQYPSNNLNTHGGYEGKAGASDFTQYVRNSESFQRSSRQVSTGRLQHLGKLFRIRTPNSKDFIYVRAI